MDVHCVRETLYLSRKWLFICFGGSEVEQKCYTTSGADGTVGERRPKYKPSSFEVEGHYRLIRRWSEVPWFCISGSSSEPSTRFSSADQRTDIVNTPNQQTQRYKKTRNKRSGHPKHKRTSRAHKPSCFLRYAPIKSMEAGCYTEARARKPQRNVWILVWSVEKTRMVVNGLYTPMNGLHRTHTRRWRVSWAFSCKATLT